MSEKPSETEDLGIDESVERINRTLDEIIGLFTEVGRVAGEMVTTIEETLKKIAPQGISYESAAPSDKAMCCDERPYFTIDGREIAYEEPSSGKLLYDIAENPGQPGVLKDGQN